MRKTITINRRPNTTNLPDHIYESSKKRIGSTFTASGDVNTGLTTKEMEKFMPGIIYVNPNDSSFYMEVKKWFTDLSIDVPPAGVDFEIGFDKGENGEILPHNVMDYVKFKFASVHPYLLVDPDDEEEKRKKRKFLFLVEDKSKEKLAKIKGKDDRKKALQEYIKLTDNEAKMDMVLRVLGEFPDSMDKDDKEIALENLAKESPSKFIKVATNKDLEVKSFIRSCVSAEVLRKVGNSYLDGEEVLGSNEEEVILFLNDKKNSKILVDLKAKLKQFSKA